MKKLNYRQKQQRKDLKKENKRLRKLLNDKLGPSYLYIDGPIDAEHAQKILDILDNTPLVISNSTTHVGV